MNKHKLTEIIENMAPPDTQEAWDCSGWIVDAENIIEVNKVMLALTITDDVVAQARKKKCDMIISHHPLFYVPLEYRDIQMYCAHTNLDKAKGGTTDTLIDELRLDVKFFETEEFVRYLELKKEITLDNLLKHVKRLSKNARYVNNNKKTYIKNVAVCSGSGSEFIKDAEEKGFDAFITGDLKYHTAVDSNIIVIDMGHFESERPVLKTLKNKLQENVEIIYAKEKSPFNNI